VGIAVALFGLAVDTLSVFTIRLFGRDGRESSRQGLSEFLVRYWVSLSGLGIARSQEDRLLVASKTAFNWSGVHQEDRLAVEKSLLEAQAWVSSCEWDKALDVYRKLARDWPGQPCLYHNQGLLELATGNETRARISFLRALSMDPDENPSTEYSSEASLDAVWARKAYDRACMKAPGDPEPVRHYVRYLRSRGECSQALGILESFLKTHESASEALARELGILHILCDRPEEAERVLRPRLEEVPSDRESWLVRGIAGILGQDLVTARESFRNGLVRSAGDPALALLADHRLGLGLVAYAEGNGSLAAEHAAAIYRLDPEHEGAILLLALSAEESGAFPGLGGTLERLAQRKEGGLAVYVAARRALLMGDTELSMALLRSFSSHHPLQIVALRTLALSCLATGRPEDARSALKRITGEEKRFDVDLLSAVCEIQERGQEAGILALKAIVEDHGDRAVSYRLMAELHSRTGQESAAFCPSFLFEDSSGLLWKPDAESLARQLVEDHGSI
jgi:Flp pilus assembly protein TadD